MPENDPMLRKLTPWEWEQLKKAAKVLMLTVDEFAEIVTKHAGSPRGSLVNLYQLELIFNEMEEHYVKRHQLG